MSSARKKGKAQGLSASSNGLGRHELVDSLREVVLFNPEFKLRQAGKEVLNREPEFFDFDNLLPCPGEDPSSLRPVVIVLLRRFGCVLCRAWAGKLSEMKPEFDKLGVRLVCIGVEEYGFDEFRERGFFKGEVYIDLKGSLFKRLQLKKLGWSAGYGLFDLRLQSALMDADGDIEGNFSGNWSQLGGTFVVNSTGDDFLLEFREQFAADRPDFDIIFDLIRTDIRGAGRKEAARRDAEDSSISSVKRGSISDSGSSSDGHRR